MVLERVGRSVELIANFERHAPRFTQPPAYLSVFCHIPTKLPYYIVLYCTFRSYLLPPGPSSYLPALPPTSRHYLRPPGHTSNLPALPPTSRSYLLSLGSISYLSALSYLGTSLSTYFIYLPFLPVTYPSTRQPAYLSILGTNRLQTDLVIFTRKASLSFGTFTFPLSYLSFGYCCTGTHTSP